jgi:NAD(P)-dependent dehydrogenase (short-subunit alcohol dehydrogenase family)
MTVTLVTGSSTGIGYATALHLARKGHHVFASMRDPSGPGAKLADLAEDEGLKLELLRLDVTSLESVDDAFGYIERTAGPVDVLVNNAGIGRGSAIEETTDEALREVLETNLFGPWRMIRTVLPAMRERHSGAIINVSSPAGRIALPPQGAYAVSKSALDTASEVLAQEVYRFNIRVAIIYPGVIRTPVFTKHREVVVDSPYAEFRRRQVAFLLKRLESPGMPVDVAETIYEAITTDTPRLRYAVGWDAQSMLEARARMTDEEWIAAGGTPMDEAATAAYVKATFGVDL